MFENIFFLIPIFMYAETHYSFRGVYSRLKKKEPEVIADIPHRIEPGEKIPVLILIKDSHLFPVRLHIVNIKIMQQQQVIQQDRFEPQTDYIMQKYRSFIFYLEPPPDIFGLLQIDVEFQIGCNGKIKTYRNDNYRISSHKPLSVYLAKDPLPKSQNWYFGDMHCHTAYTEDQAEFGAPLNASVKLARAAGLSFFAATDHSYDLDDYEATYLKNDLALTKWHNFQADVQAQNKAHSDFIILPGEEASVGNVHNRNVHFLIVNHREFIHGKGDGAERWFHTEPDYRIPEILPRLDDDALAIAAHPEIPTPFLQWLLIRRGQWNWQDYLHPRLNGMQIWNGTTNAALFRSLRRWVELLLSGHKLFIYAGNDAHGNFNRFRQIGFPFWTFRELDEQKFGEMRTAVYIGGEFNFRNLLQALRQGNCVMTDGPFVEMAIENQTGEMAIIGDTTQGNELMLRLIGKSSAEFGPLKKLCVFHGDLEAKIESTLFEFNRFDDAYRFELTENFSSLNMPCFLRAELMTTSEKRSHYCFTNPIWISANKYK